MSNSSWIEWKKKTREKLEAQGKNARIAILGVGNEFNGDDAAGILTIRFLQIKLAEAFRREGREHRMKASSFSSEGILIMDAGLAPENFSGSLRGFQPTMILLVDAADMAEPPGHLAPLDFRSAGGFSGSTHLQPLSTLGDYLSHELGCEVMLIGIQLAHSQFDWPVSDRVAKSVHVLVKDLYNLIRIIP